jgi:MraZ protein
LLFRGINEINLDAKGRMAIPARYREQLVSHCGGQMVATIDIQDPCLRIYPLPVWEELESELESLPSTNPDVRRIQRLVLGYASDLDMDGSGRILLPPSLRKYASLDKKLVLVGQGKKLELWSEAQWSSCLDEAMSGNFELPEEIASISF